MDNLTRDVLAAEKAGMHYGDWKALHPHTKPDDEYAISDLRLHGEVISEAVCRVCRKKFKPTPKFKVVCSEERRRMHELEYRKHYMRRRRGVE